jgi:hypothetical protein
MGRKKTQFTIEDFRRWGRQGAEAFLASTTPDERSKMARKAVASRRWRPVKKHRKKNAR